MKTRTRIVAALVLLGVLLAGLLQAAPGTVARAQEGPSSPPHSAGWHVVAGGGAPMAAAGRQVNGTLGQLAIGPAVAPEHTLGSGYWYGIRWEEEGNRIYLPAVARGG